jgi:hypothetical protein
MEDDVVRQGTVKAIWTLDGLIHMLVETIKGLEPVSGDIDHVFRSFRNAFGTEVFSNDALNTTAIIGREIGFGVCDEGLLAFVEKPL